MLLCILFVCLTEHTKKYNLGGNKSLNFLLVRYDEKLATLAYKATLAYETPLGGQAIAAHIGT